MKSWQRTSKCREKMDSELEPVMPCMSKVSATARIQEHRQCAVSVKRRSPPCQARKINHRLSNCYELVWNTKGQNARMKIMSHTEVIASLQFHSKRHAVPGNKQRLTKNGISKKNYQLRNESKVNSKKHVMQEAKSTDLKVHFAALVDLCHIKCSQLADFLVKYKRLGCSKRRQRERMISEYLPCSPNKKHLSFVRKSSGYDIPFARCGRQVERCSFRAYPGHDKWFHQIGKASSDGMSGCLDQTPSQSSSKRMG